MLSSWIWLCALSTVVMAFRQLEDDQALQQDPLGPPKGVPGAGISQVFFEMFFW